MRSTFRCYIPQRRSLSQWWCGVWNISLLVSGNWVGENFAITHPPAQSNVYDIFLNLRQEHKKLKKKISVENLMGYDDIICEFALCNFNLLDSPGCSYEFNVVYVQRDRSQHLLYYNTIWSANFQEQK